MSCPEVFELCVNEGGEREYEATLVDKAGVPIAKASLQTLTVTFRDVATGTLINNRNALTVLDANGGTYHDTSGLFTMNFGYLDNIIVTASASRERHIATFKATWSGGQHQWDVLVRVNNLGRTEV